MEWYVCLHLTFNLSTLHHLHQAVEANSLTTARHHQAAHRQSCRTQDSSYASQSVPSIHHVRGSLTHFVAAGVTASPYRWTPVASKAIRSGQLYALSIEQSGLTNYSPMFGIGAHAASDALQVQYGAPVPIGFGRYYPLENRAAHNDNFNTGAVFPRTEGIFRHGHPTGTPVGTEVSPAYPTGTPAGSNAPPAHATGTSTGAVSGLSGAARATYSPPITGGAQTTSLGWSNLATLALVFVGCVSALLRI